VVEGHPIENPSDPNAKSYNMKVQTDDDSRSNVQLQCRQSAPNSSNWLATVDDFFRGVSPFESLLNTFDPFRTGFDSIQNLADSIQRDIERDLNRSFNTFDVMESFPILTDPEYTSYYMRIKTDDNGHVRVKTIRKKPGSPWQSHVEEFHRGRKSLEGKEKKEALEGGKKGESRIGQAMEQEGRGQAMETEASKEKAQGVTISTAQP